jgi:hypothetical protein
MVIAGTPSTAFISHVPLFEQPHDVQMVAAGAVTTLDGSPAPTSFTDQLFTFVPDVFSLDALRNGALRTLEGQIFMGSNEHGGRPVPGKFRFTVSRVIHQHVLDAHAPAQPALTYIVFGSRDGTFAVHKIAGSPSFDEVVHVTLGGDAPSNDDLSAGVEAQITGVADTTSARLGGSDASAQGGSHTFTLKRVTSLSCLVSPDFFDPCR